MNKQLRNIKEFTLTELEKIFIDSGYPKFYGQQVFAWIYKRGMYNFTKMTDLSKAARAFLEEHFYFSVGNILVQEKSVDGTEKFVFGLFDGQRIETVLIPEGKRLTLCVSTQVGCKFRCGFCVSGQQGFIRDLTVAEIIDQYIFIRDKIAPAVITNIVLMGIGEPLDNLENVIKSIQILQSPYGVYFGKRRVCLSTVGVVERLAELQEEVKGIKLSISLHSADEKVRQTLLPGTKKYTLAALIAAVKKYAQNEKFPVTFEYILLKDVNVSRHDAVALAKLIQGVHCKVNLIEYNESPFFRWKKPDAGELEIFTKILKDKGVFFTIRKSRGKDIRASCGQLSVGGVG